MNIKNKGNCLNIVNKKNNLFTFNNIISLYNKIPVDDVIDVIKILIDNQTANLVRICVKSTYFSYKGNLYEQIHVISMGSPLSLVVDKIYMEYFETRAIKSFPITPEEWKRYVDDIFEKLWHGMEKIEDFLTHLKILSQHIKFILEMEKDGELPFLDMHLTKKENGRLGYQVYRRNTHMDIYLHAQSHHHPA
jgi:hypothetical protein